MGISIYGGTSKWIKMDGKKMENPVNMDILFRLVFNLLQLYQNQLKQVVVLTNLSTQNSHERA